MNLLPSFGGVAGDAFSMIQDDDAQGQGLIHESSLLVFKVWMELGGPTSPPTPQEVADMDASLALDMAYLLRLYRRAYRSERSLFETMNKGSESIMPNIGEWPHGAQI